jgi:hypothetical protein
VLRTLHPARDHVLVRRLPGGALEQARKVGRAHLHHGSELGQGQRVLQMRQNIGDRVMQLGRGETAVARLIEVPANGIAAEEVDRQRICKGVHDVLCSCGPLPPTPIDIGDNCRTA